MKFLQFTTAFDKADGTVGKGPQAAVNVDHILRLSFGPISFNNATGCTAIWLTDNKNYLLTVEPVFDLVTRLNND